MRNLLEATSRRAQPADLKPGPQSAPQIGLPFAHLNLRRNPFGELPAAERAELAVVDVESYILRLSRPGVAVQFIGEKGRGKTTHLLAIAQRFPDSPYVYIPQDERPRIPRRAAPRRSPLIIDEAQRLTTRMRRKIFQPSSSVVLGTHEDFSTEIRAAGLEVETVVVGERLTPERLYAILNRRIEAARRTAGPIPAMTLESSARLLARHGDDVRAVEAHLYEVFQRLPHICDV